VAGLPGAILFACNLNRVRSPVAAGLMRRLFGPRIYVDSCGLRPDPDREPDPFVVSVMDEVGVDLARHHAKTFDDLDDDSFDVVISLTPESHHRALEMARRRAVDILYWPTPDPTLVTGRREAVVEAYRDLRERLQSRIFERFPVVRTFGG
jgi:protein-tyrosine-phosphatase